jgi:hypothetical protein
MIYEVLNDVMTNALELWDYSSAFPNGYAGITQPIFVPANIWQIESQIETLTNGGQFTQVIVSVESLPGHDVGTKTFSDIYGLGQAPNTTQRLGSRFRYPFDATVWTDEQLGGQTMARKLASQVVGAMFYYRNRLSTIRHINMMHWQEVFDSAAQLFSVRMTFEGDVHITIDV